MKAPNDISIAINLVIGMVEDIKNYPEFASINPDRQSLILKAIDNIKTMANDIKGLFIPATVMQLSWQMVAGIIQKRCINIWGEKSIPDGWNLESIAKSVTTNCIKYSIDPALCLAQGIAECHFGINPQAVRSRKTMNIFNVGNTDDGANKQMESWEAGIERYCRLMAKEYYYANDPTPGKLGMVSLEMMIKYQFCRPKGGQYATAPNYTETIKVLGAKVRKDLGVA